MKSAVSKIIRLDVWEVQVCMTDVHYYMLCIYDYMACMLIFNVLGDQDKFKCYTLPIS